MDMQTKLKDRILFFDGSSAYEPPPSSREASEFFLEKILRNGPSFVFSTEFRRGIQDVPVKKNSETLAPIEWNIPLEYKEMDVIQEIYKAASNYGPKGMDRVKVEVEEFQKRGMIPLLQALIYIKEYLEKRGKPWGVGRGSSCALFTLYLLGIHSVNSLEYDLPIDEFFR